MNKQIDIEQLDKKMQSKGWKFIGPILHYKNAWKDQACVYEKDKKYKPVIMKKLGINWHELADLNGIGAPYVVYPGQVLQLP